MTNGLEKILFNWRGLRKVRKVRGRYDKEDCDSEYDGIDAKEARHEYRNILVYLAC